MRDVRTGHVFENRLDPAAPLLLLKFALTCLIRALSSRCGARTWDSSSLSALRKAPHPPFQKPVEHLFISFSQYETKAYGGWAHSYINVISTKQ